VRPTSHVCFATHCGDRVTAAAIAGSDPKQLPQGNIPCSRTLTCVTCELGSSIAANAGIPIGCNQFKHSRKSDIMASITVRNVPDEVHRALRVLAAQHGRSAEAEIRDILERAVKPAKRLRLGDALAALGRKVGITDEDIAIIDQTRGKSPAKPMTFE
jgi:plasmid stability protein